MSFLIALLLIAVPPLTDEQQARLGTAYDGRDHQEEAFLALLENARAWTDVPGDTPVRLQPDFDVLLASADANRGELCLVQGRLELATPLARPFHEAVEWFIRDASDRPILVYVVGPEAAAFEPGAPVRIFARFYKRVDAETRCGPMQYPALVGARPRHGGGRAAGGAAGALGGVRLVLPVLLTLALVGFLVLLAIVRRQRVRPRSRPGLPRVVDDGAPLPDDPADALAELRRRAQAED